MDEEQAVMDGFESHPARGGWIEIPQWLCIYETTLSHPARGGWIEIIYKTGALILSRSHPARGGWIEISATPPIQKKGAVPPRKGWVD